jgi:hypothetical protein
MDSLRMTKGDSPGKEFALHRTVTVIGKGPACDIIRVRPVNTVLDGRAE